MATPRLYRGNVNVIAFGPVTLSDGTLLTSTTLLGRVRHKAGAQNDVVLSSGSWPYTVIEDSQLPGTYIMTVDATVFDPTDLQLRETLQVRIYRPADVGVEPVERVADFELSDLIVEPS